MQEITQAAIQPPEAAIMAVKEVEDSVNTARSVQVMPRTGSLALKHQTFHWKAADKYQELWNFKREVKNIFMTNNMYTQDNKKIQIILKWLGRERLKFMQT